DLLAGDVEDAVVVVAEQQALHLARALRVDPLADEQRRRLLTQGDAAHAAGQPRCVVDLTLQRGHGPAAADTRHQLAEVGGRRPAAAADAGDTTVSNEAGPP